MSRPFVFSFVSVNGTRKVLGTREVMPDDLDEKLANVEQWLAEKPMSRCATLYGPGMRRRVVTADTRRWLEDMHIIRPTLVPEFPKGADPHIVEAESDVALHESEDVFVWADAIKDASFLKDIWMDCTVADMWSVLKQHGLKRSGVKRALASRLAEAGIAPY